MKNTKVYFVLTVASLLIVGAVFYPPGRQPVTQWSVKYFGAAGDGVTDDTTAIQASLNYAGSNGLECYFPPGTYLCSAPLTVYTNAPRIRGAGASSGFYPNQSVTVLQFTSAASNGVQWVGSAQVPFLLRLQISDMAIIGQTNGNTGAGIWLGQNYKSDYGSVQGAEINRVDLSGWANGLELHDTVTVRCEEVHSMCNTNSAFNLNRADSCYLVNCWGGWDPAVPANVKQYCIVNQGNTVGGTMGGTGLGVIVQGGEWGNCYKYGYFDGLNGMTIVGGNRESVYATNGLVNFTNICSYMELGVRWGSLTNLIPTAPVYRIINNPGGGQFNSNIKILGMALVGGSVNAPVSVEGTGGVDYPVFQMNSVVSTYTTMVYRATIGGAITTTFIGNTVPDGLQSTAWYAKPTFYGASGTTPAFRIQNGSVNGGIEFGGDSGAQTLTANTTKFGSISFPTYAGTTYTIGALQLLGDVSGNYEDFGTAQGLNTVDYMRFYAGGSQRWTLNGTSGWLQGVGAVGVQNAYTLVNSNTLGTLLGVRFAGLGNGGALLWNSNGVHGYWIATNVLAGTCTTNQAW